MHALRPSRVRSKWLDLCPATPPAGGAATRRSLRFLPARKPRYRALVCVPRREADKQVAATLGSSPRTDGTISSTSAQGPSRHLGRRHPVRHGARLLSP